MRFVIVVCLFFSFIYASEQLSTKDIMAQMKTEFANMKVSQKNEFTAYKKELDKTYSDYKKQLKLYWENPELSTKKTWVSYSKDNKSRSKVDFENNLIVIEAISNTEEKAKKEIQERLSYAISKNTKEVIKTDPLQKKVAKISKRSAVITSKIETTPILNTILFDKTPTKKELKKYTANIINTKKITQQKAKEYDKHIYKLVLHLPKDTNLKRSQIYKDDVEKNAKNFKIPFSLIFAIIQTESNFNPFAKSHVPAFGLMQIVPNTAGKDTYRFLYKHTGIPSVTYLYNGKKNIKMGSAYLHILYYKYLKKIKDPTSRLYCTIAAYNTGAGNIAWAFTNKYNMNKAAPLINSMKSDEVYNHLLSNLRFDEPKHYLKRVRRRMETYKKAYSF